MSSWEKASLRTGTSSLRIVAGISRFKIMEMRFGSEIFGLNDWIMEHQKVVTPKGEMLRGEDEASGIQNLKGCRIR